MTKRMSFDEAKRWLRENGFIHLGGVNSMDCWTEVFLRRVNSEFAPWEVAKVDGWHGNYRPWIYTTNNAEILAELCSKLDVVARYKCNDCQHEFNANEFVGDFDERGRWHWQCPSCRSINVREF
jgi:DNA-directed RNA polymerase subunit RPC12/RpoP